MMTKQSFNKQIVFWGITLLLALLICSGCSNKVPMAGMVTFEDDGSPLTRGTVCFVSEVYLARGHLQSDGTYRISSTGNNDGLPPGTYRIYVVDATVTDDAGVVTTSLIHSRFESPETSGLEFEVDGKTRRFDFTVERAPARR